MRVVKDAFINFLNSSINAIIGFLFTILLLRYADHNTAAMYFLAFSLTYLSYLPTLGILSSITSRYIAYYYGRKHMKGLKTMLFGGIGLAIFVSIIMAIIILGLSNIITTFYPLFDGQIFYLALFVLFIGPMGIIMSSLMATHMFKESLISTTLTNLVKLIVVIYFVFFLNHLNFSDVVYASVIGIIVGCGSGILFLAKKFWPPVIDVSSIGSIWSKLKYGLSSITSNVRTFIFSWFDVMILGYLRPAMDVTGYNAVMTIVRNPLRIVNSTSSTTLLPHMAKSYGENKLNSSFVNEALRFVTYIIFVLVVYISLLADMFMYLLFPKYISYHYIAPVLGIAFVFISMTTVLRNYVKAIRWATPLFVSSAVPLIVNVVLDVILVPIMGALGAAIGTLLSCIVEFFLVYMYVSKKINVEISSVYKPTIAAIGLAILGILLRFVFVRTPHLIISITLAMLFIFGIVLFCFEKQWKDATLTYLKGSLK